MPMIHISLWLLCLSCYALVFELHNWTEVTDIICTLTISKYWHWILFWSIHKFRMTSQNNCQQENDLNPIMRDDEFKAILIYVIWKNTNQLQPIHFYKMGFLKLQQPYTLKTWNEYDIENNLSWDLSHLTFCVYIFSMIRFLQKRFSRNKCFI